MACHRFDPIKHLGETNCGNESIPREPAACVYAPAQAGDHSIDTASFSFTYARKEKHLRFCQLLRNFAPKRDRKLSVRGAGSHMNHSVVGMFDPRDIKSHTEFANRLVSALWQNRLSFLQMVGIEVQRAKYFGLNCALSQEKAFGNVGNLSRKTGIEASSKPQPNRNACTPGYLLPGGRNSVPHAIVSLPCLRYHARWPEWVE
jgi:hypothetical protein